MLKKISNIPFHDTPEKAAKLQAVIDESKHDKSLLMHVMQQAQLIYGYLPFEVQEIIADGMGLPVEKVYGIATFYALFSLSPKGKYNIAVCLGTACYVKGARAVLEKLSEVLGIEPDEMTADGMFSISPCRCLGACSHAPVLTVNGEVHSEMTPAKVEKLINELKERG